eukprot:4914658-Pyramimonas_sp.AAC.1
MKASPLASQRPTVAESRPLLDRQQQPDAVANLRDVSHADGRTILFILLALQIYPALSLALGVVTDALAKRGHELNVGTAMTAAMIMWERHGTKRARHAAWHEY